MRESRSSRTLRPPDCAALASDTIAEPPVSHRLPGAKVRELPGAKVRKRRGTVASPQQALQRPPSPPFPGRKSSPEKSRGRCRSGAGAFDTRAGWRAADGPPARAGAAGTRAFGHHQKGRTTRFFGYSMGYPSAPVEPPTPKLMTETASSRPCEDP